MALRCRAAKQKILPVLARYPTLNQPLVAGQLRQPNLQPVRSQRKVINSKCHAVNVSNFRIARGRRTLVCGHIHQSVYQAHDVDATKSIFLRLMEDGAREGSYCLIRNVVHSSSLLRLTRVGSSAMARSIGRTPPRKAFRATVDLPLGVLGPVERS